MANVMHYLRWTEHEIENLEFSEIITEVDPNGHVRREIGLDEAGAVVHKYPSDQHSFGERGLFDLAVIETSKLESNFEALEFDRLWIL